MLRGMHGKLGAAVLVAAIVLSSAPAPADPSRPAVEDVRQPPSAVTPEGEYNRGIRARVASDWAEAETSFRSALLLRPGFAEAWSELGYALRKQGRYRDSLDAYGEALRLRPEFPEALAYLGEAYVTLGRIDDARRILERLRLLDTRRAEELHEVIRGRR